MIAVDRIAAKLRSLKLVIAESLHVFGAVHTMRGPLMERLEFCFMIFPSTRNREVAFKLSVSLRNLLPSILSGTAHARLR
jgi:hypothetical protein